MFNEESLTDGKLQLFTNTINESIVKLDTDISNLIESESNNGGKVAQDILASSSAIHSLSAKISSIKTKAFESERMVQDICKDIKQLDYAKRHLMETITGLKVCLTPPPPTHTHTHTPALTLHSTQRLSMLVSAVDQLTQAQATKKYKEASQLLAAVSNLVEYFSDFKGVPKIAELRNTVEAVRIELTNEIFDAFTEIGQLASGTADPEQFEIANPNPGSFSSLKEACLVVDALGSKARKRQIASFCNDQLRPYARVFHASAGEASSLDQVDRRFAWYRRLNKTIDEKFSSVFPASWRLPRKLCINFLSQTKAHLQKLLETGGSECENVTILLKVSEKKIVCAFEVWNYFGCGGLHKTIT